MLRYLASLVALSSSFMLALPAATACTLASGVEQLQLDDQPDSPTDDVVVVVGLVGQFFTVTASHISDVVIMDQDGMSLELAGALTVEALPCGGSREVPYYRPCPSYVSWRPREPMPPGDYSISMAVRQETGWPDDGPLIATQRFTVRADAQRAALAPPEIDARLVGVSQGRDELCCATTMRSGPGFGGGKCFADDSDVQIVAEPPMGQLSCPGAQGEACQLCWPTRFVVAPRLEASWRQPDRSPVYYEVMLDGELSNRTASSGAARLYGPGDANTRYCVSVTAVSLINGERAPATRCVERSALIDPAPLSAPAAPPALCASKPAVGPAEPDPTTEPAAPDASADGAGDDDAGDDAGGGCATAPGAPASAAPLWLLGALWAVRRRSLERMFM